MDPYCAGALSTFIVQDSKETDIIVHDKYCSFVQLCKIRDMYSPTSTVVQSVSYDFFRIPKLNYDFNPLLISDYTEQEKWNYITGVIDMGADIFKENDEIILTIFSTPEYLKVFRDFVGIPALLNGQELTYTSTNVIDLMGKIKGCSKYPLFVQFLYSTIKFPKCIVYKNSPEAIIPSKTRFSDVGYDIHIIKEYKVLNKTTILYDTGISLKIPPKYYVEIIPRSSLTKSGYILTNSVGIIDRSYQGNLLISLTQITPDAIFIKFPFKCCQLILRKQEYMDFIDSENTDTFIETTRKDLGFGSTG